VFAKLEYLNPGGSVKDRCALSVVEEAEKKGEIRPGDPLVEASSGNTGIALALIGAVKGYRVAITIPKKMTAEKVAILTALGAQVHVCENLPHDDPNSYIGVAHRLVKETPRAYFCAQTENQANVRGHFQTGKEIWDEFGSTLTAVVAGAATGGTISGIASYVKKRNPKVRIIGVDPEGSILGGPTTPKQYAIEGIGYDFFPATLWRELIDEWVKVADIDAFTMCRRMARLEGLFAGSSSGAAVHAALQVASQLGREDRVLTILPDGGERYLSKVYNDDFWRKTFGKEPPTVNLFQELVPTLQGAP
jgi:cystathionine beta-synthase/cysteine synthase A